MQAVKFRSALGRDFFGSKQRVIGNDAAVEEACAEVRQPAANMAKANNANGFVLKLRTLKSITICNATLAERRGLTP